MTSTNDDIYHHVIADFPFKSHYVTVRGSKMHYIEEGSGNPILFIHGMPTWSYTWRNVMPDVAKVGRCIAVDLIGMGRSDKPNIAYTIYEHIDYLNGFIQALNLKNITLVMHGWGSIVGLSYAMHHASLIKSLVFLESYIRPIPENPAMVSLPAQELANVMKDSKKAYDLIMNQNYFVNKILPSITLRKLLPQEMDLYLEPFHQPGSCKPLWQCVQELPIINKVSAAIDLISHYSKWLQKTSIPKLMLYALPGLLTTIEDIQWAKQNLSNITTVDLGTGLHYLPECAPLELGSAIKHWIFTLNKAPEKGPSEIA